MCTTARSLASEESRRLVDAKLADYEHIVFSLHSNSPALPFDAKQHVTSSQCVFMYGPQEYRLQFASRKSYDVQVRGFYWGIDKL